MEIPWNWIVPSIIAGLAAGFGIYKFWIERRDKRRLKKVEIVWVGIDEHKCNWRLGDGHPRSYLSYDGQNPSPIFDFSLFNHFDTPVVLHEIELRIKYFQGGLSGPYVPPEKIKPSAKYVFKIKYPNENYQFKLPDPIELDTKKVFRLNLELMYENMEPLEGRYATYFTFNFNNNVRAKVPVILLNSDNEEGRMKITVIG